MKLTKKDTKILKNLNYQILVIKRKKTELDIEIGVIEQQKIDYLMKKHD